MSSWPIQIPHVLPSVLLPKSTPFHAVIQTPTNTWFAGLRRVCPPSKWLLKWFYHFCTADAKLPCMDHSIMPHGTFVHPCLINHWTYPNLQTNAHFDQLSCFNYLQGSWSRTTDKHTHKQTMLTLLSSFYGINVKKSMLPWNLPISVHLVFFVKTWDFYKYISTKIVSFTVRHTSTHGLLTS